MVPAKRNEQHLTIAERRFEAIPTLPEEVAMACSGGDRIICPIVIGVVELVVLAGIWTAPRIRASQSQKQSDALSAFRFDDLKAVSLSR